MAIIKCPNCGREISDKAHQCVHCGETFTKVNYQREFRCSECGTVLTEADTICFNCGCPVDNVEHQQVDVTKEKKTSKLKGVIAVIVAFALIGGLGGIFLKSYSDAYQREKEKKIYNEYIDNLIQVQEAMLAGGSDSESLCNLTYRVWGNAIYEDRDEETDKYTRPDGYFVSDFNIALENLYADENTQTTVSRIEENKCSVKKIMKELQTVPEGLEDCFDSVMSLNEVYNKLTNMAVNPTGSYQKFGDTINDVVPAFTSAFDKLDTQIPEKKE